ncbi:MAG: hypothetical protein E3J90_09315 [Promethearchaeota archaeon]|nr:MAG: hypothetical protein E3J90_09315 [Candidatus Lokiarchaeota archaeon]
MIYTIFLYQRHTGLLIFDKSFQDTDARNTEMFSSFISAMKTFVSEIVIDSSLDRSNELTNIELSDYIVIITSLPTIKVDLVIITDKEDSKSVNKLIPKLVKFLNNYEQLFLSWDGDREEFDILDHPLTELVLANVKVVRKSLLKQPDQILRSIWAHRKQLTREMIDNLIQERDLFIYRIEKTVNLPRKATMAKSVINLSEKLKDEITYLKYMKELKRLNSEIRDAKFKVNYYLEKIKVSLNEAVKNLGNNPIQSGDFKNAYLNLYSFSTKLKLLNENDWKIYRDMASRLIDKEALTEHELSEIIQNLLKMSSNIDDYLG